MGNRSCFKKQFFSFKMRFFILLVNLIVVWGKTLNTIEWIYYNNPLHLSVVSGDLLPQRACTTRGRIEIRL